MLTKQFNLQTIKCDNAKNSFNAIFAYFFYIELFLELGKILAANNIDIKM